MQKDNRVLSPEQVALQQDYIEKNRVFYLDRLKRQPMGCVVTFGCQQNEADTELIKGMMVDMGFALTETPEKADVLVFNTCAIREHAEMRALGNVGETSHYKKANPSMLVCICGCMVQQQHVADKVKASYPYVDIVFGTHALWRFPEFLHERLSGSRRIFDLSGDERGLILENIKPVRKERPSAWLSIAYGCNNFCSYCVVPYVRGRERSRRPEDIVGEAERLLAQGYRDITLLGQNVNSYGSDLEGCCAFPELLRRINALPGDFRVRFMTSHPKDATHELFDTMAACEKVCRSIHLPVQSGSDRVLKRMNRRYDSEKYISLVDYARKLMPEITITSDIIVGFPGETEEDFEQTVALLEKVRFDSLFTFIYSRRKGTPAYDMPEQVPRDVKQVRFDRLMELQNRISWEKNEKYVGTMQRVLIDGISEDKNYELSARTEGFKLVHLRGDRSMIGEYADVLIERNSTWALFGRMV